MTNQSKDTTTEQQASGNIDGLFHYSLAGWFHLECSEQAPKLTLLVDGRPALNVAASLPRPDVQAALGHGETSGFAFDLSALNQESVSELRIVSDDCDFTFNDTTIKFCKGIAEHYNYLKDLFFPEFYCCKYDLCQLSNEEAFQHFITCGIFEDKDPSPWFSSEYYREHYPHNVENDELPLIAFIENEHLGTEKPSSLFDPVFYKSDNPDLAHEPRLFWHYTMHGHSEGRKGSYLTLPDHVIEEFHEISALDPLIARAEQGLSHIVRYPHISKAMYVPRIISQRFGQEIKAVICVPFITRGGADLISTFVFRAYQEALGKEHVLMMVTDQASIDVPEWLDGGSKIVCLDDECTFINDEERVNTLHFCLGHLAPEKIINVNSHTLWKLYERHGAQLSSVADLYAYLFCFDYNQQRQRVGYITDYLPKTIRYLKSVFCDNAQIIEDMNSIYGFHHNEAKKLHTVYVPAAEGVNSIEFDASSDRDTVLWVGRLSLQKRPDVLVSIAQAMPGQQFDVYGPAGNAELSDAIINGHYENIRYRGVYSHVNEIDYSRYAMYLNTSEWEGLPTIIIQMMAIGLPIVTSSVCGITELVSDQTGWLIEDFESTPEYVKLINSVLINKDLSLKKREAAFSSVSNAHSWVAFFDSLAQSEAFVDHHSTPRINAKQLDRRKAA